MSDHEFNVFYVICYLYQANGRCTIRGIASTMGKFIGAKYHVSYLSRATIPKLAKKGLIKFRLNEKGHVKQGSIVPISRLEFFPEAFSKNVPIQSDSQEHIDKA